MENEDEVHSKFAISRSSFEKFLMHQIESGFSPLAFETLSEIIIEKRKHDRTFMVTFDDIYESVYRSAYPFLRENNIPFIIFVSTELIDKPKYITTNQLLELSSDPLCTVGSHGCRHVMFRYLQEQEVAEELKNSKNYLENLTGKKVDCFAFPYGRIVECSPRNIRQLSHSDYLFGFSAIKGNLKVQRFCSKFFLPRINVEEKMI
jgi:peptidoglycan/xylan/chitin deacetylase (PgdA/CDA1 family)